MKRTLTALLCLLVALTLSSCITINIPAKASSEADPTGTPEPTLNPYAAIDANSVAEECNDIVDTLGMDGYHFLSGTTYMITLFMPESTHDTVESYLSPTSVDEETYIQAKDSIERLIETSDRFCQAIQGAFDEADHSEVTVFMALYVDDSYDQPVLFWRNGSISYSILMD